MLAPLHSNDEESSEDGFTSVKIQRANEEETFIGDAAFAKSPLKKEGFHKDPMKERLIEIRSDQPKKQKNSPREDISQEESVESKRPEKAAPQENLSYAELRWKRTRSYAQNHRRGNNLSLYPTSPGSLTPAVEWSNGSVSQVTTANCSFAENSPSPGRSIRDVFSFAELSLHFECSEMPSQTLMEMSMSLGATVREFCYPGVHDLFPMLPSAFVIARKRIAVPPVSDVTGEDRQLLGVGQFGPVLQGKLFPPDSILGKDATEGERNVKASFAPVRSSMRSPSPRDSLMFWQRTVSTPLPSNRTVTLAEKIYQQPLNRNNRGFYLSGITRVSSSGNVEPSNGNCEEDFPVLLTLNQWMLKRPRHLNPEAIVCDSQQAFLINPNNENEAFSLKKIPNEEHKKGRRMFQAIQLTPTSSQSPEESRFINILSPKSSDTKTKERKSTSSTPGKFFSSPDDSNSFNLSRKKELSLSSPPGDQLNTSEASGSGQYKKQKSTTSHTTTFASTVRGEGMELETGSPVCDPRSSKVTGAGFGSESSLSVVQGKPRGLVLSTASGPTSPVEPGSPLVTPLIPLFMEDSFSPMNRLRTVYNGETPVYRESEQPVNPTTRMDETTEGAPPGEVLVSGQLGGWAPKCLPESIGLTSARSEGAFHQSRVTCMFSTPQSSLAHTSNSQTPYRQTPIFTISEPPSLSPIHQCSSTRVLCSDASGNTRMSTANPYFLGPSMGFGQDDESFAASSSSPSQADTFACLGVGSQNYTHVYSSCSASHRRYPYLPGTPADTTSTPTSSIAREYPFSSGQDPSAGLPYTRSQQDVLGLSPSAKMGEGEGVAAADDPHSSREISDDYEYPAGCLPYRNVAVKVFPKSDLGEKQRADSFRNEVLMGSTLDHPSLVHWLGLGEDSSHFYLVMDMVPCGTLSHWLEERAEDREERWRWGPRFLADIVLALEYLHNGSLHPYARHRAEGPWPEPQTCSDSAVIRSGGELRDVGHSAAELSDLNTEDDEVREEDGCILHRDLKPSNFMLTNDGHLRLGDFGTACFMGDRDANTYSGTVGYMSPEMVLTGHCGQGSDLWSAGCVLYELLEGKPLFHGATGYLVHMQIKDFLPHSLVLTTPQPEPVWRSRRAEALDLLSELLQADPLKRLGGTERGGFAALKAHPFFSEIDWAHIYDDNLLVHKGKGPGRLPAPDISSLVGIPEGSDEGVRTNKEQELVVTYPAWWLHQEGERTVFFSLVSVLNDICFSGTRLLLLLTDFPRLVFVEWNSKEVALVVNVVKSDNADSPTKQSECSEGQGEEKRALSSAFPLPVFQSTPIPGEGVPWVLKSATSEKEGIFVLELHSIEKHGNKLPCSPLSFRCRDECGMGMRWADEIQKILERENIS